MEHWLRIFLAIRARAADIFFYRLGKASRYLTTKFAVMILRAEPIYSTVGDSRMSETSVSRPARTMRCNLPKGGD